MSEDYLIKQFLQPDWNEKDRVHNWRNYITDELKVMWESFTDEQKIAIGRMADEQASAEIWE